MVFYDSQTKVVTVIALTHHGVIIQDFCAVCIVHMLMDTDPCLAVELLGPDVVTDVLFG